MSTTSDFVHIVTSGFASTKEKPKIFGSVGPAPDANYCGVEGLNRFAGKSLPSFAHELRFVFPHQERPNKRDIYDYFDFWLISENQKLKLDYAAASSFEFLEANTFDNDGSGTSKKYWIAKVIRQIDCIDARRSMVSTGYKDGTAPFADDIYEIELDESLAPRFANDGPSTYRTYAPSRTVQTLELVSEKIPADCDIFAPMFWPGHVICRADFFYQRIIDDPYNTWGLRLPDINRERHSHLMSYR